MSAENIITIVVAVLSSGLISTILQRHWSQVDRKNTQAQKDSEEARREQDAEEIISCQSEWYDKLRTG